MHLTYVIIVLKTPETIIDRVLFYRPAFSTGKTVRTISVNDKMLTTVSWFLATDARDILQIIIILRRKKPQ